MSQVRLDVHEVPTANGINGEMQALYIALKTVGENVPFATLMGIAGLAFRLYWHVGKEEDGSAGQWSESSLEACTGMHPLYMACQWIGWSYSAYNENTLDEMYELAKASIVRGIPALTRGPVAEPIPALFVGYYEEDTRKLDVINKHAGNQVTSLEIPMVDLPLLEYGHWRNPVFIVDRGETVPEEMHEPLLMEAFGRCAEALHAPDLDGGRWIGGVKVYERIAEDLSSMERLNKVWPGFEGTDHEDDMRVYFLHDFLSEVGRARGTAYEFLDTYIDQYPIEKVARGYEKVYELYQELREIFPDPNEDYAAAHKALFDESSRNEMAEILKKMAAKESKAAELMEKKIGEMMSFE